MTERLLKAAPAVLGLLSDATRNNLAVGTRSTAGSQAADHFTFFSQCSGSLQGSLSTAHYLRRYDGMADLQYNDVVVVFAMPPGLITAGDIVIH
jgi:hypothetical protein